MTLSIPSGLATSCRKAPERAAWLRRLPETLRILERQWSLTLDAPIDDVSCSYVARVSRADGTSAVLKVAMPHMGGEHEIRGLRFWDGDPTVRLLAADEDQGAMLLERCEPGTPLRALPEYEQDVIIARLLRRLWRVPPAQHLFRPLSALMRHWSRETLARRNNGPNSDPTWDSSRKVCAFFRSCRPRHRQRCCSPPTCTPETSCGRSANFGWPSTPSPLLEIPSTTRPNTCSIAGRGYARTLM